MNAPTEPHPAATAAVTELDTLVVGAGLSGLGSAYVHSQMGERVHVVEKSARIGGAIQSDLRDGYLVEAGPNSMLIKSPVVEAFIGQLGLNSELVEGNAAANKRFLVKNARVLALPASPLQAIRTPLYSFPAKLRLLAEPFIGRSAKAEESVADFVTRRMGREFLDYGISALVSGIFAGDANALSIRYAFPKVWALEERFGSLIRGAVGIRRERRKRGETSYRTRLVSFRKGLQQLPNALLQQGNFGLTTQAVIQSIDYSPSGPSSGWTLQLADQAFRARSLILTCPLGAYPQLPVDAPLRAALDAIPNIPHPPLSTLVLGFDRSQIRHPLDGFGVLFPRRENRFTLGAIFSSTLFPGRAPEGKVALMCFIGGITQPDHATLPSDSLIRKTVADLEPLLGISGHPEFTSHSFWPQAIPQYNLGHGDFIAALDQIEAQFPGLYLRGNFRGGPGLNDCLLSCIATCPGSAVSHL